jgi:hypothetical protein
MLLKVGRLHFLVLVLLHLLLVHLGLHIEGILLLHLIFILVEVVASCPGYSPLWIGSLTLYTVFD